MSLPALGQWGTVTFNNRLSTEAPVFDEDGLTRLAGNAFFVQLYGGPSAGQFLPAGIPVPFHTGNGAGYVSISQETIVQIPNVAPGAVAFIEMRAWKRAKGKTFEEAAALRMAARLVNPRPSPSCSAAPAFHPRYRQQ